MSHLEHWFTGTCVISTILCGGTLCLSDGAMAVVVVVVPVPAVAGGGGGGAGNVVIVAPGDTLL